MLEISIDMKHFYLQIYRDIYEYFYDRRKKR